MAVSIRLLVLGPIILLNKTVLSQDIQTMRHAQFIKASGSINMANTFYTVQNKQISRKPMGYLFAGNLNLKILGVVDAPFSFLLSNQGSKFTQPYFNQTSIHPKYKWVQLHGGTLGMSWSPYTLNGHRFNGAAVDLTPRNIEFSVCGGQFLKASVPLAGEPAFGVFPSYSRKGCGIKAGYRKAGKGEFSASVFYAADDSASAKIDALTGITPKENLAIALKATLPLGKRLSIRADGGSSWLNEDTRSSLQSTLFAGGRYNALKASADLALGKHTLMLGFEHVDPGYRTLGGYYFNNDLENITAGGTLRLLRQKVNISGQFGKQRDNLNNQRLSTMGRVVSNVNVQAALFKGWNANAGYSNFLSYSNLRSFVEYQNNLNPYALWDTLNFRQISRNIQGSINGILHKDSIKMSSVSATVIIQNAADYRNGILQNGSAFINAVLAYNSQHLTKGWRCGFAINAAQMLFGDMPVWNICPALNAGGNMIKGKGSWNLSAGANSAINDQPVKPTLNLKGGMNYNFNKWQNLNIAAMWLQRSESSAQNAFNEGSVSIAWRAVFQ